MNVPVSRLVKLALAEGHVVHSDDLYDTQQGRHVEMSSKCILNTHSGQPKPCMPLPIEADIKLEHKSDVSGFGSTLQRSSVVLYRTLQPEYQYADYLSISDVSRTKSLSPDVAVMVCMYTLAILGMERDS